MIFVYDLTLHKILCATGKIEWAIGREKNMKKENFPLSAMYACGKYIFSLIYQRRCSLHPNSYTF